MRKKLRKNAPDVMLDRELFVSQKRKEKKDRANFGHHLNCRWNKIWSIHGLIFGVANKNDFLVIRKDN